MMTIGGFFNAPVGDSYYRVIQPAYMKYITLFFNKFINFSKWKQVSTSVFIDMVILCIPLIAGMIFWTEMINT